MSAGKITKEVASFTPLSPARMRRGTALARRWFHPEFLGLDELDLTRPALFVGNHTLFGLLDAPLMIEHLYTHYGVMLRGLGHRDHYNTPVWGDLLVRHGMVLGTPENCSALMEAGENILVFPGGSREVMRRKGERYRLIWKQRTGFARMAIQHGYDIVPFGSVGPDESFDILVDANDLQNSAIGRRLSEKVNAEKAARYSAMIPPIARGVGPTMIPRPQRYYFGFGPRISTEQFRGQEADSEVLWTVRTSVEQAVEAQIGRLLEYRQEDRLQNWSTLRRILAPLADDLPQHARAASSV